MSREIMQQCLDLITELDKDGVVYELGLILELRNALGIPDRLKMKAELAKPEHPLDKKADNARDLGLDYEPEHGFDRTASHMAGEYVDTAEHEPPKQWVSLTDEEIHDFDKKLRDNGDYCSLHFAWGISAKLKEKNSGEKCMLKIIDDRRLEIAAQILAGMCAGDWKFEIPEEGKTWDDVAIPRAFELADKMIRVVTI